MTHESIEVRDVNRLEIGQPEQPANHRNRIGSWTEWGLYGLIRMALAAAGMDHLTAHDINNRDDFQDSGR